MRQQRVASSVAPARRQSACARVFLWGLLLGVWGRDGLLLEFALLQPLDVMAQLQCGPQFQTHIFHNHVAAQEHQSFSIDLLQRQRTRRVVSNCCEERRRKKGERGAGAAAKTKSRSRLFSGLTCFLNSSACGANAVGSASRTNCITSSMDQEEGFLPGSCAPSRSDARDSGPVVELAANGAATRSIRSTHRAAAHVQTDHQSGSRPSTLL